MAVLRVVTVGNLIRANLLTKRNCPAPWQPCFSTSRHHFQLFQDNIVLNLLTKFHEDRTCPASWKPYSLRTNLLTKFHEDWTINFYLSHIWPFKEKCPALDIIGTNLLTKFHEDRKINVASRVLTRKNSPPLRHVFQPTGIIFELVQDIIGMNLLTKFHEDGINGAP
ncbi:hypothetical protein DPMN_157847, partial [Dreissena polymorpha]